MNIVMGRRKSLKRVFSCLLVMLVLTSAIAIASTLVVAATTPVNIQNTGSVDVGSISKAELVDAIMAYMKAMYLGEEVEHLEKGELRKLACLHFYHGRYPRTITAATGENVTIYKPLERIVVLNTDVAEAIRVLGAKDRIVGITDTITKGTAFFPEISKKTVVGGWKEIDPELVLQLDADAVFAYGKWPGPEYIEDKLPPTITVIRLDFYKPETLRDEMLKLGYLLDEEENASKYINWHDKYVDEIEDKVSGIPEDAKPNVFMDKSGEESTKVRKTYTKKSGGISTLCELAGGKNIAAELEAAYPEVDLEWILDQNPEIIVGLSYEGGYEIDDESVMKEEYERIIELPGFGNITAVEDERVYLIDDSVPFAPGYPIGLAYNAKWFYPEEFEDLDPQAIHQEYVDKFCGIDFDVTKHGVFVYPQVTE
jgi:iron complex transport system substrate-binding protein